MAPIDHTDTVAMAKADLERAGVPLSGPCGAFAIVQLAAWRRRADGAGFLQKNEGNNCMGFSPDCIAYPDGALFDVLIDSGGANKPASQEREPIDPTRWSPAFLSDLVAAAIEHGSPAPPLRPPSPTSLPPDAAASLLASLERIVTALEQTVTAVNALNTRLDTFRMNGVRVHL